jgi:hypothetical protein
MLNKGDIVVDTRQYGMTSTFVVGSHKGIAGLTKGVAAYLNSALREISHQKKQDGYWLASSPKLLPNREWLLTKEHASFGKAS